MQGQRLIRILLLLLLGFLPPLLTPTDAGAVKKCYDCHKKEKEKYTSWKYRHQPANDEDCETCHKRHGFAQQLILQDTTAELCYSCHGDLRKQFSEGHVHFPVSDGKCWDCHDPHGSDKKGFLRTGPEGTDDPGSCLICHKTDLESSLAGQFPHEPFAKRECLTCHTPHNSPYDGLLATDVGAVCASCHKPDNTAMQQAHKDRNTAGLACNDCHSGHSSNTKGLLSANTHAPFAEGECEICHSLPDESGKISFEEGVTPGELCAACHDDIIGRTAGGYPHAAVESDNCNDCHRPHSSRFGSLLKTDQRSLCEECHTEVLTATGLTPHLPVVLGQCSECHEVHGSEKASLLKADDSSLCLLCHQGFAQASDSAAYSHAAVDDCLTCHQPHEGMQAGLLRSDPTELCRNCHEADQAALSAVSGHQPYLTANCLGCHQPHYSDRSHLVRDEGTEACLKCHPEIGKRVNMPNPHPPAVDDCTNCHEPHYSANLHLLSSSKKDLCESCHDFSDLNLSARYVHTPAKEGDCTGCHNPHGGTREKLVTGRLAYINVEGLKVGRLPKLTGKTSDLCYTCHDDLAEAFRKQGAHAPVLEGACDACHAAHGSESMGFVKAAAPELCGSCHSLDASLAAGHGGYDMGSADCLGCHNPHLSEQEKLLRNNVHPPFADESCDVCHEQGENNKPVLSGELTELCGACHDSIDEALKEAHQHAPFEAGECVNCHGIHAADFPGLLKTKGSRLCFSCHDDVEEETKLGNTHQPFSEGKCLGCHKPHSSQYARLITKPPEEFCLGCHTELKEEIDRGEPHKPVVSGECAACHQPHSGNFPALLTNTKDKLCGGCHELASAKLQTAHSGFKIAGTNCQNCHAAHVGPAGTKGLLLPEAHAPFADGECASCHQNSKTSLLTASVKELCLGCHDDFAELTAKAVVHEPVKRENGCTNCHGPHVGYGSGLQVKDGPKTCFTCHNDAEFSGKFKHQAAFEDCGTCHQPHAGDYKYLLETSDIIELCLNCHDDATKTHYHPMGEGVIDPRSRQTLTCVSCHSPHSSDNVAILVAERDRKLCIICHDVAH